MVRLSASAGPGPGFLQLTLAASDKLSWTGGFGILA